MLDHEKSHSRLSCPQIINSILRSVVGLSILKTYCDSIIYSIIDKQFSITVTEIYISENIENPCTVILYCNVMAENLFEKNIGIQPIQILLPPYFNRAILVVMMNKQQFTPEMSLIRWKSMPKIFLFFGNQKPSQSFSDHWNGHLKNRYFSQNLQIC